MSSDQEKCSGDSLLAGLLFGLVSGVIFTLLYTPKTGREVREDLKSRANGLPREMDNLLLDIKDLYNRTSDIFKTMSKEQCAKFTDAIQETRQTIKNKLNDTLSKTSPQEADQDQK